MPTTSTETNTTTSILQLTQQLIQQIRQLLLIQQHVQLIVQLIAQVLVQLNVQAIAQLLARQFRLINATNMSLGDANCLSSRSWPRSKLRASLKIWASPSKRWYETSWLGLSLIGEERCHAQFAGHLPTPSRGIQSGWRGQAFQDKYAFRSE